MAEATHQGITGQIFYHPEDRLWYVEATPGTDVLVATGNSPQSARQSFERAVDDYLNWCGVEDSNG